MKFNDNYVHQIINSHGIEGQNWLLSIESLIKKYSSKLRLTNIELSNNLTTNIIFNAHSEIYGDVIIKMIFSEKTFFNEINFINNCKSKYMVKCFYSNLEDRIMVLEKIKPGLPLTTIKSRIDRIKIFSDIMNGIVIPEPDEELFRDYYNSLLNKTKNQKIISKVDENIKSKIKKAIELYDKLDGMNLSKYVLHRDLHHDNILKDDNSWKVIDPQGVIGYRFFELTQFIKSELSIENNDIFQLEKIIEDLSVSTSINSNLIYMALYIDTVEKILYFISIGAPKDVIDYNIKICDEALKNIE